MLCFFVGGQREELLKFLKIIVLDPFYPIGNCKPMEYLVAHM